VSFGPDSKSNHFEEAFTWDMESGDEPADELFESVGHVEGGWCDIVNEVLQ